MGAFLGISLKIVHLVLDNDPSRLQLVSGQPCKDSTSEGAMCSNGWDSQNHQINVINLFDETKLCEPLEAQLKHPRTLN